MTKKAAVEVLQDDDADTGAQGTETEATAAADETDEQGEQPEQTDDGAEGTQEQAGAAEEAPEIAVTFGTEESPPSDDENRAPEWVRELRKADREKARRIRELEEQLRQASPAPGATVVGTKPTLESCDYDAEKYEAELEAWHARKRKADSEAEARRKEEEAAQAEWNAKREAYGKRKSELKVRDFDDAEEQLKATMNVTQQGVILQGAADPALLVYALGKNPAKAKELAAITDPVKFAFAVAKLETQLKVTPKKAVPLPEKPVRGGAPVTGAVDSNLERLRAEAERTGDFSKVFAYKQQQRAKRAA